MTPKQQRRQRHRESGKYAKVNPCYACGKSSGDDYFSHPDTDNSIDDELLCLCHSCYDKLKDLPGKEAIEVAFNKEASPPE